MKRKSILVIVTLALQLYSGGCASQRLDAAPDTTPLFIGDLIHITIPDLISPGTDSDTDTRIEADGSVSIPYLGHVKIAGMTPEQACEFIRYKFNDANVFWNQDVRIKRLATKTAAH